MDSEREGEGGKIWENGIETCKISCMISFRIDWFDFLASKGLSRVFSSTTI